MTDDVKYALTYIWGPWARKSVGVIGYPRETTIGRCMREGPAAGHGARTEPDNHAAETIEASIIALGDPRVIRALRWRHAYHWRVREIAKRLRVSRQTVSGFLNSAYRRLTLYENL